MATNNPTTGSDKWTNNRCIEIAFSDHFPSAVKDTHVQKKIIETYLNIYLGGKLKGLKMTDLTFAVISIMPQHEQTESLIWENNHYKEDGTLFHFTPPPEGKLRAEIANIIANENDNEHNIGEDNSNRSQDVISSGSENTENIKDKNKSEQTNSETNHTDDINVNNSDDKKERVTNKDPNEVNRTENTLPNDRAGTSRDNVYTNTETNRSNSYYYEVPNFPSNLQWFSRRPDNKVIEVDAPYYGPVENSAFTASCNKLLEQWDTNVKGRIVLKYLFGIIALVTLRATTKKYTHLVNTFRSRKFLTHITFADSYVKYSTPHKRFVKNSYRTFCRRDGKIPVMFAKIVVNSFHIDAMRRLNPVFPLLNVFKLTVLSHTADYGFGLVTMLQNIDTLIGATGVNAVLKATYCDKTAESWNKLLTFLYTYMANKSKEATHHWARVINIQYFEHLTCANNYALSVILAVFIEKLTNNSNIWQSTWVSSHPENIQDLKDLGHKMFKQVSEEVQLGKLMKEVAAKKGKR